MTVSDVFVILLTLTALFSYVNARYVKLPTTIGVMLIALTVSLGLAELQWVGYPVETTTARLLERIDFDATLLQGMQHCRARAFSQGF
jgi:CPA1 family monovalent cation:H+ antiporter